MGEEQHGEAYVVVVGAGLAGLSAALDLKAGGADVVVLEAPTGPGRVVQTQMPDGRLVQLGGEVTGGFHGLPRTRRGAWAYA